MAMILIGQNSRHVVNHALALVKIRWKMQMVKIRWKMQMAKTFV